MIKHFVGGDMGCALCTFFHNRASFFRSSQPGKANVQAKTREPVETEQARLN